MTYQNRLKVSVGAKLIVGDISVTLLLVPSTNSVADLTEEIMAVLRSKHPPVPVDTRIVPFPDECSLLCATPESILAAIKSFEGSSSVVVAGLRPDHIRDLVSMDANEPGSRLLNSISRLLNHILNEDLSYWSRDALFASSLTSLREKDIDIRSNVVDNVFRRIACKLAYQSRSSSAQYKLVSV